MLFTDGDSYCTGADLASLDPEVGQLSLQQSTQQPSSLPPIIGPESVIARAIDHVGREIIATNGTFTGYLASVPGSTAQHLWAVMTTAQTGINRPKFMLNQVVVSMNNPTKTYIQDIIRNQALYYFFQSLYHRKIDDRYETKMLHYEKETKSAWQRFQWSGTPIVLIPLAAPGALREYGSGVWSNSNVSAGGSGSSETGSSYDCAITWTSQVYQTYKNPMNGESAPSTTVSTQTTAGQVLTVTLAGLNPPNGIMPNIGVADGIYTPAAAVGWNVYVGNSGETLYMQNSTPIPVATTTYTLPNVPVANNMSVGRGQNPDYFVTYSPTIGRA